MPETLEAYRARTAFMEDSLPHAGPLCTTPNLTQKIAPDGTFRPFCGDTLLFTLNDAVRQWLAGLQEALYEACGDCLSERLSPQDFHITLHDLHSQPDTMPEAAKVQRSQVQRALDEVRACYPHQLRLRSRCLFSMAGTSIVMGFEPLDSSDQIILASMYGMFQRIVPLPYPLTLHVTLAYYRPGEYDEATVRRLREAFCRIGREEKIIMVSSQALRHATFLNMNRYDYMQDADPWKLSRFVQAQTRTYLTALREIRGGRKLSHWMWFIFPQLQALGHSTTAKAYGIINLEEATAYLAHPTLGPRLIEISSALLSLPENDPRIVMGHPDWLKLRSCMTLFGEVAGAPPVFHQVLEKYYGGIPDERTLALLGRHA